MRHANGREDIGAYKEPLVASYLVRGMRGNQDAMAFGTRFTSFGHSGAFALATFCLTVAPLHAQVEGPQNTRVLVRAETKGSEAGSVTLSAVKLELGNQQVQLTRFSPVQQAAGLSGASRGQQLEVALLIDDGLRGNFDNNLPDIEKFVSGAVSPTTSVGVGYMRNGSVYFPQGFSKDAEVEKKAVRLPISTGGISGSPYFCVEDLLKHWPTHTGANRVVLMITNGIDLYNGSVSPLNQDSPYVDEAIREAQRAYVPVYSIYFGRRNINSGFGSFSGQGYLGKMADETGGVLYNQGTINPPSISPFFTQFEKALSNTYVAEFPSSNRKPERLKVSSTAQGVKLYAQKEVQQGMGSERASQ